MTTATTVDRDDPAHAGQAVYTRSFLSVYDAFVYGFNSPVLWRCPKSRVVEHYDAHVSARHLDIGVGTGTLLDACHFPVAAPEITLMDLTRTRSPPRPTASPATRRAPTAPTSSRTGTSNPAPTTRSR